MINNAYLFYTTVYQLPTVYQLSIIIIIINRLSVVHIFQMIYSLCNEAKYFWDTFNYLTAQRTKKITKANVQIYKHIQASKTRMTN